MAQRFQSEANSSKVEPKVSKRPKSPKNNDSYISGSRSISTAELGSLSSKALRTSGCNIPNDPSLVSSHFESFSLPLTSRITSAHLALISFTQQATGSANERIMRSIEHFQGKKHKNVHIGELYASAFHLALHYSSTKYIPGIKYSPYESLLLGFMSALNPKPLKIIDPDYRDS